MTRKTTITLVYTSVAIVSIAILDLAFFFR